MMGCGWLGILLLAAGVAVGPVAAFAQAKPKDKVTLKMRTIEVYPKNVPLPREGGMGDAMTNQLDPGIKPLKR